MILGDETMRLGKCTLLLVLDFRFFFSTKILKLMQLVADKGSFHITNL